MGQFTFYRFRFRWARPQWSHHWSRYQRWPYRLIDPSPPRARSYWWTLPSCRLPRSQPWSAIRIPGKPILMRVFVSQQTSFCVVDGSARVLHGKRRAPVRPSTCRPQRVATNVPSIGIRAIKRFGNPGGLVVAGDGAQDRLPHQGGATLSRQSAVSAGSLTCAARRDHHSPPRPSQPRCRRKADRFPQAACPQKK